MAAQGPRTSNDTLIREGGILDLRSGHDPSAFHIGLANTRASTLSLSLVHPALASGPVRRWVVSSRMPSTGGGGGLCHRYLRAVTDELCNSFVGVYGIFLDGAIQLYPLLHGRSRARRRTKAHIPTPIMGDYPNLSVLRRDSPFMKPDSSSVKKVDCLNHSL